MAKIERAHDPDLSTQDILVERPRPAGVLKWHLFTLTPFCTVIIYPQRLRRESARICLTVTSVNNNNKVLVLVASDARLLPRQSSCPRGGQSHRATAQRIPARLVLLVILSDQHGSHAAGVKSERKEVPLRISSGSRLHSQDLQQ